MLKDSNELKLPEKFVYVSSVPSAYNFSWGMDTGTQYLGGDAYNYMIEASLKAGYYNAVSNQKVITFVSGLLLLFISVLSLLFSFISIQKCVSSAKQIELLESIERNTRSAEPKIAPKITDYIPKSGKDQV